MKKTHHGNEPRGALAKLIALGRAAPVPAAGVCRSGPWLCSRAAT